jgi:DNA-binding NarL/FixJ family response regulator
MIRLLLADDHPLLRQGIRSVLEGEPDITVMAEAATGQEVLDICQHAVPDMVVMDVSMPEMDGISATRELHRTHPEVAVLMLTMHHDLGFVQAALDAGATGYLLKETAARDLVHAVRAVVHGEAVIYPSLVRGLLGPHSVSEPKLTGRELEVLTLIAAGNTTKEIAAALFVSVKTVETHRLHLMEKLNLHDRVALVKYALRRGLIGLDF